MTPEQKIKADLERFQATGELPDAWEVDDEFDNRPNEINWDDAELDRRVDEMNREREAIESGCHEPCPIHCARPCCAGKGVD